MIDYEKLKTLKARIEQGLESIDNDKWSMSDSIDVARAFMKVSLSIADELIESNGTEELTKPKPKYEKGYEKGQEVWFLGEENQLCNDEITHSEMGGQNYIYYLLHYEGLFHESILYPTKQSLIESQLTYWQNQLSEELEQHISPYCEPLDKEEHCEVSGVKLDTKCPHGITPRNCPDCVLPECQHERYEHTYTPGFPDDLSPYYKCKHCGEFYR